MSLQQPSSRTQPQEAKLHSKAQKVLLIAQESPVSLALSDRLTRLGIKERIIRSHKKTRLENPSHRECFLGDWNDPMTLLLALQDIQGVFVDLSSVPSELYTTKEQIDQNLKSQVSHGKTVKGTNRLWEWHGLQRSLSRGVKELLGTYKPPSPTPEKHSAWYEKKKTKQLTSERPLDQSVLSYALLNSSATSTQVEKPLIFLVPSVCFDEQIRIFLSDENLASYQLAGWRTNIIFYDWLVGDLRPKSSSVAIHNLNDETIKSPGVLTPLIEEIFIGMSQLKSVNSALFSSLLEGEARIGGREQALCLVDLSDLISVALIVYQTQVSGERYLLRGDRLTWSSLMQICAHLIDPLTANHLNKLNQINPHQLSTTWQLTQLLQKASRQASSFKDLFKTDPLEELNQRIESLLQKSTGGALTQGHGFEFSELPHQFSASPIVTILEEKLKSFLATTLIET